MSRRPSRRTFLRSIGASSLLLPVLEVDLARAGCLANPPKRAVFVVWSNGILPGNDRNAWPTGPTETTFTIPAAMSALEPHRGEIVFIDKLKYQFLTDTVPGPGAVVKNGHESTPGLLTARRYAVYAGGTAAHRAAGPSIDQVLGAAHAERGYKGIPSLYLGVRIGEPSYVVWKAARQALVPEGDPFKAFAALFAGASGAAPDPALERLRQTRKSVLDFVSRDVARFSRGLGTADRARVEQHHESLRSIEKRLAEPPMPTAGCAPPALGEAFDVRSAANIPRLLKLQIDLLVAGLAADLSRVAVLQFGDGGSDAISFPWLGLPGSHNIAHPGGERKAKADAWIFSQWAYLLERMKAEKEGGRSLLDSSVALFLNNMAEGNHSFTAVPAFLAGSAGGYFKTGRALKTAGGFHQPLLVSVANAVGVPLTSFGDPEYNSGEMPGLRG